MSTDYEVVKLKGGRGAVRVLGAKENLSEHPTMGAANAARKLYRAADIRRAHQEHGPRSFGVQ